MRQHHLRRGFALDQLVEERAHAQQFSRPDDGMEGNIILTDKVVGTRRLLASSTIFARLRAHR
jgi:hypothetical protein